MNFEYVVLAPDGKILKGIISANTVSEAKENLRSQGAVILEIKEEGGRILRSFHISRKIRDTDLYNLFKELSILLKSGIRIEKALEIINNTANSLLKEHIENLLKRIKSGDSISNSFKSEPIFSPLSISIIEAGESIGNVQSAFENISDFYRFQIQFKSEIKSALAYPTFLIFASFFTIFIIFRFVLPRFFAIFSIEALPFFAKILYAIGMLVGKINFTTLILVILGIFFGKRFTPKGLFKGLLWRRFLNLPFIRTLALNLDISRFSYSMASMLKGGVDFASALFLAKNTVLNENLRSFLDMALINIRRGQSIGEVFSSSSDLPEVFCSMVKVGEESGNLTEVFFELYNIYDEKFKSGVKRLLSLVEPIVITLTGIIVGFIVISLILTVMSAGVIKL